MVHWSYDLLTPPVRATFARLGVFALVAHAGRRRGGVRHRRDDGAGRAWSDHHPDRPLAARPRPVPQTARRGTACSRRFGCSPSIGWRRRERFDSTPTVTCRLLPSSRDEGGAQMYGPHEQAWRIRLELEEPNLQIALTWCAERDPVFGVRLAVALWPYWDARWRERQGVEYIEALLRRDLDLPEDLRAWALTASAAMNGNAGRGAPDRSRARSKLLPRSAASATSAASPRLSPRSAWRSATRANSTRPSRVLDRGFDDRASPRRSAAHRTHPGSCGVHRRAPR